LREDNADLRLSEVGHKIGLASSDSHRRVIDKQHAVAELMSFLEQRQLTPTPEIDSSLKSLDSSPVRGQISLAQLLRRPEISLGQVRGLVPNMPNFSPDIDAQAEIQIKYQGYVTRQTKMVQRFQKMEELKLPSNIDYSEIQGLSREVREKLMQIRPRSLGQASRIPGITPAAISLLSVYLKKRRVA
jgi:tRNA uridine 5-carboxymethylaminomethyl modification enzyme